MVNRPQRRAPTSGPARASERELDVERRIRQVKEVVRLGTALRAEMGLGRIFTQLVEAVHNATGFRVAALNIVRSDSEFVEIVATAGLSEANQRELMQHPPRLQALIGAMLVEYRHSRSYFIPHQDRHVLSAAGGVVEAPLAATTATAAAALAAPGRSGPLVSGAAANPDAWDAEDALLTPLVSPRNGRLLGVLSLDQPDDGLIPSLETIEIIELFADQAALAIDTSRIFAEREQERQTLGQGLMRLRYHLDLARNRDLRYPTPPLNNVLDPLVVALNDVLDAFNTMLTDAQAASEMVNQHATEVRAAAVYLAESATDQAERILELSTAVDGMSQNVRHIAATANNSSQIAEEASEFSRAGSENTALAVEGMARVRELTLQTKKKVKRLGESAQEIGDIVQLVAEIAAQTNLLALNASIEAARAGEHGRGFAVVAQEIRRLATSASEATRQIHTRIQGVQHETSQVVVQIEHSVEQVVLQSELVTQAGAALAEVAKLNLRLATDVQQINDIASEQARAAMQVAAVIKDLAGVSTETSASMEQASASMDYLVDLAESLQQQVSVFQLRGQPRVTSRLDSEQPSYMQPSQRSQPLSPFQPAQRLQPWQATTQHPAQHPTQHPAQHPTQPAPPPSAQLAALPSRWAPTAPQAAPPMGRLRMTDGPNDSVAGSTVGGMAPAAPPARYPDATEPSTQPMTAVSGPLAQGQGAAPNARALLQETAPAPSITNRGERAERSRPLSLPLSSPVSSPVSSPLAPGAPRGSGGLGSGGLGVTQPRRTYATPLLADDDASGVAGDGADERADERADGGAQGDDARDQG